MVASSGPEIARRGAARAASLRASGTWTSADDAELDRRFEAAATAALRVPALAERSARLRRLGRRLVPTRLRPGAYRAARAVDRAVAAAAGRYHAARGGRP